MDLAAALLVILASGAAVLFIAGYIHARKAGKLFDKADARARFVTNEMTEAGLLAREFKRGAKSRDGEIRWFAVKWEGEHERANEYTTRLDSWETQLGKAFELVSNNPDITASEIIAVLSQLVEQGREEAA